MPAAKSDDATARAVALDSLDAPQHTTKARWVVEDPGNVSEAARPSAALSIPPLLLPPLPAVKGEVRGVRDCRDERQAQQDTGGGSGGGGGE